MNKFLIGSAVTCLFSTKDFIIRIYIAGFYRNTNKELSAINLSCINYCHHLTCYQRPNMSFTLTWCNKAYSAILRNII